MQPIQQYLQAHHQRFVNELCEYVRFPSVSAQPKHHKDLQACAQWLEDHCRRIGLNTRLYPTDGNPILIAQTPRTKGAGKRPRFLVYGHYDVQPPEPFDLWSTQPFEPTIQGDALFGRGASDNKGQHLAHLNAVEAYLQTGTELPCDITFLIEGEEEIGSHSLNRFLKQHRSELRCDAVIISDNGIPSLKYPALTYALRGITALEILVKGPSRDLHSGIYGGSVDNPAMVLCQLLARLRDNKGRIAIPDFYKDVVPLTRMERRELARVPYSEAAYRKFLGVPQLYGENGYTPIEQRSARPTLEINGLISGYQGEGSKTIVPAWARAKLTFRLVPHQHPQKINQLVRRHLQSICPPTVRMELTPGHGGEPYRVSPQGAYPQACLRALKHAFNREPILLREGGSIPIVTQFKKQLKADTLLLGLALPDDNAHSPNEKFSLNAFRTGIRLGTLLWPEIAAAK